MHSENKNTSSANPGSANTTDTAKPQISPAGGAPAGEGQRKADTGSSSASPSEGKKDENKTPAQPQEKKGSSEQPHPQGKSSTAH